MEMNQVIGNENLELAVSPMGAEMKSLVCKRTGRNLLWGADPKIWEYTAPVCCPWCGKLEDGYFEEKGKRYLTGMHGFTREKPHRLVKKEETSVTYLYEWTEDGDTWPWSFQLETVHRLEGEQAVTVCTVTNTGTEPMPVQLGFHTGFLCPFSPEREVEDYCFRFEKEEAPDGTHILPVTRGMFDNRRIPFPGLSSEWIRLEERESGRYIQLDLREFDYLLLWSVPGIPGFVCMEPWSGFNGKGHDLWKRPGTRKLMPGEQLSRTQRLTIKML